MVKKMHASPAPSPANKKAGSSRKSAAASSGPQDSALAKSVKESAQHIWLAGMGAFSKAQEEGTKVFEALVKEGQSLQRKTQAVAEEKIGEVTGKMTSMAGTVQAKANQNWDKLEGIFEARTAKALSKLGVPTAKDVEALIQRVDELATAVARLSRQGTGTVKTTPTRATKTAKAAQTAAAPSDAKKVPRKVAKTAPRTASKTAVKTALKTPARRARKSALAAAGV
jgi:poly(hydroxyalkanoate) granule-associated protein